jgi:hypothetical protein
MDAVFALIQWFWAPVVTTGVSVAYFRASKGMKNNDRFIVSLHGASIAIIYVGALLIFAAGLSRPSFARPYWLLFIIPAGGIVLALSRFRGNRAVHFLQVGNVLCAAWALFIGTMAVTGEWL